jgi:hypothetical protein
MPIAFRAAATPGYQNAGTTVDATLPASAQVGDVVLAFQALSDVIIGDPSISGGGGGGSWNVLGAGVVDDNNCRTKVWWRSVVSGDAGATITASWTASGKGGLLLAAWSGVHLTSPIDTSATTTETGTDATHDAPGVTPGFAGCWVVEYVAQRSGAITSFAAPVGRTERAEQLGTGAGTVCQIIADSNGSVTQGVASGVTTYTSDLASANAVGWSVSLRPAEDASGRSRTLVHSGAVQRAASW